MFASQPPAARRQPAGRLAGSLKMAPDETKLDNNKARRCVRGGPLAPPRQAAENNWWAIICIMILANLCQAKWRAKFPYSTAGFAHSAASGPAASFCGDGAAVAVAGKQSDARKSTDGSACQDGR